MAMSADDAVDCGDPESRPLGSEWDPRKIEHGPRSGETILFLHGGSSGAWAWSGQVELLPQRHLLTPELPGYAGRACEDWPGTGGAADDVATLIRDRAIDGKAHVVGLSLGGFVALQLAHKHPELLRSCLITGSAVSGYSRIEKLAIAPQVPLWRRYWYWAAQAFAFRIPAEVRKQFAADGCAPSARTNRAMFREVVVGGLPRELAYTGPMLAVSGEKDSASVRRGFPALCSVLPQTQTCIVPGVHHAWNAEDPELFARMVTTFADTGQWDPCG